MLYEFILSNQDELIRRCTEKVATRLMPAEIPGAIDHGVLTGSLIKGSAATAIPAAVDHGVPMFMAQLAETLRLEQLTTIRTVSGAESAPAPTAIGRAAALNGADMLRSGYSVDQVVRGYGDVCQAITDMAVEQVKPISADEFRTLNRCLDDAIADAVTSHGSAHQNSLNWQADALHKSLNSFCDEQRRLIFIAIDAYNAIKTGNIGVTGATGTLLLHALKELHALVNRTTPEIHLATARTTLPSS